MPTTTTILARCTVRDVNGILCWGVLATLDGSKFTGTLPCGHEPGEWLPLMAKYNADYPCDPACVYARGAECICSCGGQNHSVGWIIPPNYTEGAGFRMGVANDSPRFQSWLLEAGRQNAIEQIQRRHQNARIAAETRWIRTQGWHRIVSGVAAACRLALYEVTCPACHGTGRDYDDDTCSRCQGRAFFDWLLEEDQEQARKERERAERQAEREAEHQRRLEQSHHLGEIGERLTLTLRLLRVQQFGGMYGVRTLHTFETPDGCIVKWWASGDSPWELDFNAKRDWPVWISDEEHAEYIRLMQPWQDAPRRQHYRWEDGIDNDELPGHDARICGFWHALGAEIEVSATVKAHGTYQDVPETTVTRVHVAAAPKRAKKVAA